jgi:hypothetical protein
VDYFSVTNFLNILIKPVDFYHFFKGEHTVHRLLNMGVGALLGKDRLISQGEKREQLMVRKWKKGKNRVKIHKKYHN